jgi:hypothetical protein
MPYVLAGKKLPVLGKNFPFWKRLRTMQLQPEAPAYFDPRGLVRQWRGKFIKAKAPGWLYVQVGQVMSAETLHDA